MTPNFMSQMQDMVQEFLDGVHTSMPGTIQSFDPASCMAVIGIDANFRKPNGEQMKYPPVANVPVILYQYNNQNSVIVAPIKPGDGCEVFFSEQANEAWKASGANNLDLKHDVTNAVAVVGLCRKPNPYMQEACDDDATIIWHKGVKIKITAGKIEVTGADIYIDGNIVLKGNIQQTGDKAQTGNLNVSGNIIDGGENTNHHTH